MKQLNYKQNFLAIIILYVMVLGNSVFANSVKTESMSELIAQSYRESYIDKNEYLIQTLRSYFAPSTVDKRFREMGLANKPTRGISTLLSEAKKVYDELSDRDKKFIDMLLKRPVDTSYDLDGVNFYLPAPVKVFEPTVSDYPNIGGKFKFWYVDHNNTDAGGNTHQTTLADVEKMADEFEKVYQKELIDMGYKVPPFDTGTLDEGNDTKFDIYIMNLGKYGIYGYVAPEAFSSSGDNATYGYMVMDNDFIEFAPTPPEGAMQVTAAHEYHHAVQMGINAFVDAWYMEVTSTWMEERVYDSVNDNRLYLGAIMNYPEISLDFFGASHQYAAWIFNEYLSTNWDNNVVKDIWDQLDPVGSDDALSAIDYVLTVKGTSLKNVYRDFWAKNYQKNNFYDEGTHWPAVKIENSASPHILGGVTTTSPISFIDSIPEQSLTLNHMAAKLYKFKPNTMLTDKKTLVIEVSADTGEKINAIAVVKNIDGSYREYPIDLNSSGKGEVGISGFSTLSIEEVVLIITNYSMSDDSLSVKYNAYLAKPITFVIDDTGSMESEISAAKLAANTVLDTNKASGKHYFYTLLSFKDGPATLRGQSADEDIMKDYINALYASGGDGCPESAFLSIRQATELAENSDIYIMTDADSNSYGVDDTYATWGELWETVAAVLNTNSHIHAIIYGECYTWKTSSKDVVTDDSTQADSCSEEEFLSRTSFREASSGIDGYTAASSETGGLYFRASASTTEDITKIILNHSSADSTVAHFDANASTKTYTLPIDSSIEKFEVVINVNSGATATVTLKDPSGNIVTNSTTDVSLLEVSGNSFYLVSDSAVSVGDWTVEVNSTGDYTFASKGFTDNALSYFGDTSVGIGGDITIKTSLEKEVTGLKFYLVNVDDDTKTEITLSNTTGFIYEGKVTMNKGGSYRLLVQGDGSFQRMYPSKLVVNEVNLIAPSSKNVKRGDNFTYTFTIENKSDEDMTYNLYATSSQGWADLTSLPATITVSADSSENVNIDVNVSTSASSGAIDVLSLQVVDTTNALVRSAKSVETRVVVVYDLDEDGDVDVTDIMMVVSQWGLSSEDTGYSIDLDLDDDGRISIKDIMLVATQFGWSS